MSGYRDLETGASRATGAFANEVVGTFFITAAFLVFGVSGWGALAVGGMLMLFTLFNGEGHYNAAATVMRTIGGDCGVKSAVLIVLAQIVGATLAVFVSGSFGFDFPASVPGGSITSGLKDALLTLLLLLTYARNSQVRDLGLSYAAGLAAFPSTLGANASIVLGVILGNVLLGGGLQLGMDAVWAVGAPVAVGALFKIINDALSKVPRNGEVVGTFLFATLAFSIGFDNLFGVGIALHTVTSLFPGAYNPAVTLAAWAKGGFDMKVVGDPIIDIAAQTIATLVAVILVTFLGTTAAVPSAVDLGPAAVLEGIFALVFVHLYNARAGSLVKGLGYYAATSACASSLNTAFGLGLYLASLVGFGEASLELTALVDPLIGGVVAALIFGKASEFDELVGTALLFLVAGATATPLARGAAFVALHKIYDGSTFNPALTIANDSSFRSSATGKAVAYQIGGAVIGGLFATYAGAADALSISSGGLSDGGRSMVAELLLAALLVKTYDRNGSDTLSNGLSYFALLVSLGAVAGGSLANPALVLGNWVGGGLVGGGFDFGGDALLGLAGHIVAPVAGGILAGQIFDLPSKMMLDKLQLSSDEFFGTFLLVLTAAGVPGDNTLALGFVLMTIYNIYGSRVDLLPALSAYRALGDSTDVGGLLKKLAAQTLGGVLAVVVAGWLLPASDAAGDVALMNTLIAGTLLGLVFNWGAASTKNTVDLGLVTFVSATLVATSKITLNGAASIGSALVGIVTGDGVGFATDPQWWAALLAPLVGGILAGRLMGFLGK